MVDAPRSVIGVRYCAMNMTGTYFTDISHFLDDEGKLQADMRGPARRFASFLVLVIDAASQKIPNDKFDTHIRCRQPGCLGSIRSSLMSTDGEISWACSECGHHGVISNWQGTEWDQRADVFE
jgi:hypothetical protein